MVVARPGTSRRWNPGMRSLLTATVLFLAASSIARADDVGCVSTTFNLLSPNDKVCVSDFDDPKVPGVTCFISQARKGGWGQPLGLNEDPSLSCLPSNGTDHHRYLDAAQERGGV